MSTNICGSIILLIIQLHQLKIIYNFSNSCVAVQQMLQNAFTISCCFSVLVTDSSKGHKFIFIYMPTYIHILYIVQQSFMFVRAKQASQQSLLMRYYPFPRLFLCNNKTKHFSWQQKKYKLQMVLYSSINPIVQWSVYTQFNATLTLFMQSFGSESKHFCDPQAGVSTAAHTAQAAGAPKNLGVSLNGHSS